MSAYADYTYYTDTYLGESIPSGSFARLSTRSSAIIDRITFQRAEDVTDSDDLDAIKMATCAIADEMYEIERSGNAGVTSESVGRHSVTYTKGSKKYQSATVRYIEAARLYLEETGLMFRGFQSGEYGGIPDADE